MAKIIRVFVGFAIGLGLAASAASPALATGLDVFGLTGGKEINKIVRFDGSLPGTIEGPTPVTGVMAGETLVGIDFRPATGQLIGLAVTGNTTRLYDIDPETLVATEIGAATVNSITGAAHFGVDFNPTVDRLRVVTDLKSDGAGVNVNNFRLNPNNGALAGIDPDLAVPGLPGGNSNAPEVGVAYTNNFAGATSTVLFGIVSGGDRLVQHTGAGFPTLVNVGLLGVDTSENVGFDIVGAGNAFAILDATNNSSGFYAIDLATGAATSLGTVGDGSLLFAGMTIGRSAAGAPAASTVVLLMIAASLMLAGILRLSRRPRRTIS